MHESQRSAQFKRGVVTLHDPANKYRVRVKIDDEDGTQSFWLSVISRGSMGNRHAHIPRIGEQVACLLDWRGEDGVIIGGVYSQADASPLGGIENDHVTYEDDAVHEHDPVTHVHRTRLHDDGKLLLQIGKQGGTKMLLTKDGITVNKEIVVADVPDIPMR